MVVTSRGSDLRSRIREQDESATRQIEETRQQELKLFGDRCRQIANSELSTIGSAFEAATARVRNELQRLEAAAGTASAKAHERLREDLETLEAATSTTSRKVHALLLRRWGISLVTGAALCLGIFGASWLTMQWLSSQILSDFQVLESIRAEIGRTGTALDEIERYRTWGVRLVEYENGVRVVVLPAGAQISRAQSVDGRPVYVLPNE